MRVNLSDVCRKGSSGIAQKDIEGNDGEYPIYGASGFIKNVDFYHQESPYIAVVKDGAGVGRVMLLPPKSSVIGTLQYLLPNDNICTEYLFYAVQYMNLAKYYTGATIPHIYFKDYQKEQLPLPPMQRQQEIAGRIQEVDKTIDICNTLLEKHDTAVQSCFMELFGDYIEEEGVSLVEVASISGGLTKNPKRPSFPMKMPYLRVANVYFNRLVLDEILEIGVKEEEIEKTLLKEGDLLFVEGNGSIEQIGRVPVWDGSISPCLHQNHLIKARFKDSRIDPYYAMYFFMTPIGRNQIVAQSVSTSGLNTLSVRKIESLKIPVPPKSLQDEFSSFLNDVNESKELIIAIQTKADCLKSALMQKYFS